MWAVLSTLLVSVGDFLFKTAVKKMLIGAGVGLVTFEVLQNLYSAFLSMLQQYFSQLANLLFAINLTGIDVGMSMIVSAIGVRIAIGSQKLAFSKL